MGKQAIEEKHKQGKENLIPQILQIPPKSTAQSRHAGEVIHTLQMNQGRCNKGLIQDFANTDFSRLNSLITWQKHLECREVQIAKSVAVSHLLGVHKRLGQDQTLTPHM